VQDQLVGDPGLSGQDAARLLAAGAHGRRLRADAGGPVEELLLDAALLGHHHRDPGVGLLEDAWRGAHERRLHHGEVVDDLVDAPVDGGGEADLQREGEQHLAEDVGQRQPEVLQVARVQDVHRVDRGAVERPDPGHLGHLVPVRPQLVDLGVVLGEHDPAARVADDVRDVGVDGGRVDRRRRTPGAHDGEVGQGPLVAGGGGDGHAVLGADPEGDEAGGEPVGLLPDLRPGDRIPGLAAGEAEGLTVRGLLDPGTEEVGHAGGPALDDAGLDRLLGCVELVLVGRGHGRSGLSSSVR
jgi:hypothetical protein